MLFHGSPYHYRILSLHHACPRKPESKDPRTLGNLFYLCCNELKDISFTEIFQLILTILENTLKKYLTITKNRNLQDLIEKLFPLCPYF